MTDSVPELVQVVTTVETEAEAEKIAQALLKQRLAACVHVEGPLASTYWWKGKIESAREYRCTIKTRGSRLPEVFAAVHSLHPYEVPELLVIPILDSGESYRQWLLSQMPEP